MPEQFDVWNMIKKKNYLWTAAEDRSIGAIEVGAGREVYFNDSEKQKTLEMLIVNEDLVLIQENSIGFISPSKKVTKIGISKIKLVTPINERLVVYFEDGKLQILEFEK